MSARSLRSGIIKTGDSIQRATRRNTILYKTENGFQQARQIDKRPLVSLMLPTCSPPKRKRKESPSKQPKPTSTEPKKVENKAKEVTTKPQQTQKVEKDEPYTSQQAVTSKTNATKTTVIKNEVDNSMRRTPRMASLNAIVKVNAVLDSLCRTENKKKIVDAPDLGGKSNTSKGIERCDYSSSTRGRNTSTRDTTNSRESRNKIVKLETGKNKEKNVVTTRTNVNTKRSENVGKEMVVMIKKEKIESMTVDVLTNDNVSTKENKSSVKDNHKGKKDAKGTDHNSKTKEDTESDISIRNAKTISTVKDNLVVKANERMEKAKFTRRDTSSSKREATSKGHKEADKGRKVRKTEELAKPAKCTSKNVPKDVIRSNKTVVASNPKEQVCARNKGRNKIQSKVEIQVENYEDDDDEASEASDSESVPYDLSSPESAVPDAVTETTDQAIQTDVNEKSMQTDGKHLPNLNNKQLCTCKLESESSPAISHYSPMNQDYLAKPFYVKSSVLAHTNNHTLVVPIKKRHVLKEKENEYSESHITNNISTLIDACINNTLLQNNNTSKLVYLSSYKEKNVLNGPNNKETKNDNAKSNKNVHLQVPKINFGPVQEQKSGSVEKHSSKSTPAVSSKQKIKSPPGRRRKCNGWQFEGDPMEEPYTLGSQIITRRHYESVSRNKEVLHIHDAVLLKSGLAKGSDYLARISMFWEDLTGPNSGDMMMSIYWYYKPGQTNFKFPETSKMEVYASRHRDDNSVACIVEKCYVVSFTQFCRFQAQKMLLKEKRRRKLKVVPEKNLQSRFLPSPDVDESIVFFCRYGYEHRCGKIIKGL